MKYKNSILISNLISKALLERTILYDVLPEIDYFCHIKIYEILSKIMEMHVDDFSAG